MAPMAAISALAAAAEAGEDVLVALGERAKLLSVSSRLDSLASTRSALKAWHAFAVTLLNYDEKATLPPRNSQDVALWLASFINFGTASNYVSAVRWACVQLGLSDEWDTPRPRAIIKGGQKQCRLVLDAVAPTKTLFTTESVRAMVSLADAMGVYPGLPAFILVA